MAALTGTGNVTTYGATGNVTTVPIAVPANVQVGHLLLAAISFQNANNTIIVNAPSGDWIALGTNSPGNPLRAMRVYGLPITTSAIRTALPSSFTFTTDVSAGRGAGMMWLDDNVDLDSVLAGYSGWATQSTAPATPAYAISTASSTAYIVSYSNTSVGTAPAVASASGMTSVGSAISQAGTGSPQASTVVSVLTAAALTTSQPARTVTMTPTPASASAYQFALKLKPVAVSGPRVSIMRGVGTFPFVSPATADVMYSPTPTLTVAQGTSVVSGATLVPPTDSRIRYRGAGSFAYGTVAGTATYYAPLSRYPYTWGSPGGFGYEFNHTGSAFEIYFRYNGGATGFIRLRVNGQRVTALASQTGATSAGNGHVYKVDFGSSATRRITVESASMPLGGIYLAPGDTITAAPASTQRLAVLGDSISGGSDVNTGGSQGTWVARFASYAGCDDAWNLSIGGSGFIADGQGVKFQTRLPDVVATAAQHVIVWGGYNDGATSLSAAASTLLSDIKAALPSAHVYLIGMWNPTSAPNAGAFTRDGELHAAALANACPFISPITGDVYDRAGALIAAQGRWLLTPEQATEYVGNGIDDTVHPTDAGHAYLAMRMNQAFTAAAESPATVSIITTGGVESPAQVSQITN